MSSTVQPGMMVIVRSVEDSMGVTIKGDPQYGIVATATWQNPLQTARVAMQP